MSINAVFVRLKERRRKRKRKKKKQEKKEPKKRIKNKEKNKEKEVERNAKRVRAREGGKAKFLHTSNKVCKTPPKHLPAVWRYSSRKHFGSA